MITIDIVYLMAAYFLFIFVLGGRQNRIHSAILFLSALLNVFFQLPESTSLSEYIYNRNVSLLWDGATALMLTGFLPFDKIAWKQALLLAFAVLCHSMIIYDLSIASSWFTLFFYSYYDELIITVGLLQMMVSYDGLIRALDNLQELLFSGVSHNNGSFQGLSAQEKGEAKA